MNPFRVRPRHEEDIEPTEFIDISTVKDELRGKAEIFKHFHSHAKKYGQLLCRTCMNWDWRVNKNLDFNEWEKYILSKREYIASIEEYRDTNPNSTNVGTIKHISVDFICPKCGNGVSLSRNPMEMFADFKMIFKWSWELSGYKIKDFPIKFQKKLEELEKK